MWLSTEVAAGCKVCKETSKRVDSCSEFTIGTITCADDTMLRKKQQQLIQVLTKDIMQTKLITT